MDGWRIPGTRETAEARVIAPISRRLTIVSAGWSPSTEGEVQGPVVYVSAKSPSELDKYKTKLNGAIVILDEPNTVSPLYGLGHPAVEFPLRAPYAESGGDAGSAKAFYETPDKVLRGSRGSCNPEKLRESIQSDADVQCFNRQLRTWCNTDSLSLSRGLHLNLALIETRRRSFAIDDQKRF